MFNDNYDFETYCDYIVNAALPLSRMEKITAIYNRFRANQYPTANQIDTFIGAMIDLKFF